MDIRSGVAFAAPGRLHLNERGLSGQGQEENGRKKIPQHSGEIKHLITDKKL